MGSICCPVPLYIPTENTEPLASGLWGLVLRVKNENKVVKVHAGRVGDRGSFLLEIEKQIYKRLGDSELVASYLGLAGVKTSEGLKTGLNLRYYPLGSLEEFFNNPSSCRIWYSRTQQLRWASQAINALSYLHSKNIVHGDFGIHNLLVDDNFDLRVADFGGSSLDGSEIQVGCKPRYHRPHSWRMPVPGVDDAAGAWQIPNRALDTFALGTVLFEIFTGAEMYRGKTHDEIRWHAVRREYPDLGVIDLIEARTVISNCWRETYEGVDQILEDLGPIWKEYECD